MAMKVLHLQNNNNNKKKNVDNEINNNNNNITMKVLGLQNKGVSKRLEEYSEEEILQAFQKESENLSQYKTIQHSSSINIIV